MGRRCGFQDQDPAAPAVTAGWLATFADSQLNALVAEAVVGNRDLAGAGARLEQAKSRARQAGADLGPTLGFAAQGQATGSTAGDSVNKQGGAGLALSWELDVWGRVSSAVSSEQAKVQATALDFAWARESLAANVARGLFFARLCAGHHHAHKELGELDLHLSHSNCARRSQINSDQQR